MCYLGEDGIIRTESVVSLMGSWCPAAAVAAKKGSGCILWCLKREAGKSM